MDLRIMPDPEALAATAAEIICEVAAQAVRARGSFSIALSGGYTPQLLFGILASHYQEAIAWDKVFVYWGDERCVPPDHTDSNYRMARETLLEHIPITGEHIFRLKAELEPHLAASDYETTLKTKFNGQVPDIDLILLGMGDDGHTASLFPHTAALHETKRWVVPNYLSAKDVWRLTLTVPVINNAKHVMFLVTGTNKAEQLRKVLQGEYKPDELPAQLINPTNGQLIWGTDQAAAKLL